MAQVIVPLTIGCFVKFVLFVAQLSRAFVASTFQHVRRWYYRVHIEVSFLRVLLKISGGDKKEIRVLMFSLCGTSRITAGFSNGLV
jgi:hypothetical protein